MRASVSAKGFHLRQHPVHVKASRRPSAYKRQVKAGSSATRFPSQSTARAGETRWQNDVLHWTPGQKADVVDAATDAPPVIICPGFGNNTGDYLQPFGVPEEGIATVLQERGFKVYVLPVERTDWLQALSAVFSPAYWSNSCTTGAYRWYLELINAAVDAARLDCGSEQVDLIGHSAGGWLARAFLSDPAYFDGSEAGVAKHNLAVRSLLSLGSPHLAPPSTKVRDQTGGALTWVDTQWPGAYFADQGVNYVCVSGRAVRGNSGAGRRSLGRYAHDSYSQLCGKGHQVEGDCVVPNHCAFLQGAENVLLDGVMHSMSRVGSFKDPGEHIWYGSAECVDSWAHHLAAAPR